MKHKRYIHFLIIFTLMVFAGTFYTNSVSAISILGSAESFAVLAGSTVTNTGSSVITGNLGVNPGSAITGFPPGIVNGTIHGPDGVTLLAQNDVTTAYNALSNMPFFFDLTGQDLGGLTLTSGVYHFNTSAQLTGTLNLDAQGLDNPFWVFQIGSTLTTASSSVVQLINPGLNNGSDAGLFWQVGSSATLGTSTAFEGNILALTSITLNTSASILNGRALARNGAVTLDSNIISNICLNNLDSLGNPGPGFSGGLVFNDNGEATPVNNNTPQVPEPSTMMILGSMLTGLAAFRKKRTA